MIEFKAIEFFSGIGGLHHALLIVSPNAKVVQAFDVNSVANCCYSHTFGLNPCSTSIDRLSACLLDSLDANVWLLSPPCQPFTAGGKRLDNDDPRSSGLLHLIRVIAQLEHVPDYLLLENVPNFEDSECRNMLVECLLQLGFNIQEYLVSPLQLGIPYDRKRYYLTAYRRIGHGSKQVSERGRLNEPIIRDLSNEFVKPKLISDYLDQKCSIKDRNATCESEDEYLVPESFISRQKFLNVDLVKPSEFRVSTITKAYGTYHLKSGSFLQTDCLDQHIDLKDHKQVMKAKPRFLTPDEIARLHGFPMDENNVFEFPRSVSRMQQYRLLGNSLSVDVVAKLLSNLLKS